MTQTRESSPWWYYPNVLWLNPYPDPVQPQNDVMDTFNLMKLQTWHVTSSAVTQMATRNVKDKNLLGAGSLARIPTLFSSTSVCDVVSHDVRLVMLLGFRCPQLCLCTVYTETTFWEERNNSIMFLNRLHLHADIQPPSKKKKKKTIPLLLIYSTDWVVALAFSKMP